jgi:ankyrin repeat protein
MVQLLLDHGADTEAYGIDDKGRATTALIEASAGLHRSPAVVKLLLAEGAAVDGKSSLGYTALNLTAWRGDPTIVRLLLAAGADVNAKDEHGRTSLTVALKQQHLASNQNLEYGRKHYRPLTEVVRLLKKAGGKS